jgi:hypothetical protein
MRNLFSLLPVRQARRYGAAALDVLRLPALALVPLVAYGYFAHANPVNLMAGVFAGVLFGGSVHNAVRASAPVAVAVAKLDVAELQREAGLVK